MSDDVRNWDGKAPVVGSVCGIIWHENAEMADALESDGRQGTASGGTDDGSGFDQRLKAWHSSANNLTNRIVIVARAKDQAIALSGLSRQTFEQDFRPATGSWWHRFAQNGASVWVESRTDEQRATGIFYRPVGAEADAVVEQHMHEFRKLPVESLIGRIIKTM